MTLEQLQQLEIGTIISTRTLPEVLILTHKDILFIKDDQVNIENIKMLLQHKDIKVLDNSGE